jgi:pSer/pThr/pTyr-binding forkhead associated (FHA) protein
VITLTVTAGPDANTDAPFSFDSDVIVIGRTPSCDLMLHDSAVGRRHCEIRREGQQFVLRDLGSGNGTFVNDQTARITMHVLRHRDEIRVGRSRLLIEFAEGLTGRPDPSHLPPPPDAPPQAPQEEKPPPPPRPPVSPPPDNDTTQMSLLQQQPQVTLRILAGKDAGYVFAAKPGIQHFTVGRSQKTDFPLADQGVSRTHFSITITPTSVVLEDEKSLNGTFVNDVKVSRMELRGGEEIRVCDTRLKVDILFPRKEPLQEETTFTRVASSASQRDWQSPAQPRALPPAPPVVQTKPRTTPWISRSAAAWWMTLLSTAAAGVFYFTKPTFFAGGPLSEKHAAWEGECAACHSPWKSRAISANCSSIDCHATMLQPDAHEQDDCTQCHTEHQGRLFNVKNLKTDGAQKGCWAIACHKEEDFLDRPVWRYYKQVFVASRVGAAGVLPWAPPAHEEARQNWQASAPHVETGLIFAHQAHTRDSKQEECLTCHQPLPGAIINALGAISAFPTHEECETCHPEVGNRDPQLARARPSPGCRKCHTREDGGIRRTPRTLAYVNFSHDHHKQDDCTTCHFTIASEEKYQPVQQPTLYALPMDACRFCHTQRRVETSCLDCHRAHHRGTSLLHAGESWWSRITFGYVLLGFLTLESSIWAYFFFRQPSRREP